MECKEILENLKCRTCQTISEPLYQLENDVLNILMEYIPIKLDTNMFICHNCKRIVLEFHDFKRHCLEVECAYINDTKVKNDEYVEETTQYVEEKYDNAIIDDIEPIKHEPIKPEPILECYPCAYCQRFLSSKLHLKEHIHATHTETTTYTCPYCHEQLKTLGKYTRHFNMCHLDINPALSCQQCSETFHVNDQIKYHVAIEHVKAKCHICHVEFATKNKCQLHMYTHGNVYACKKRKQKCENKKTRKCPACKLHVDGTEFDVHVTKHTRLNWLECHVCREKCYGVDKLTGHLKRHDLQATIACDVCDEWFFTTAHLELHKRKHKRDKTCACGKRFISTRNLTRHMATAHAQTTPVACHICEKSLRNRQQLKIHLYGHKVNDNYEKTLCNICGELRWDIRTHVKNVHLKSNAQMTCRYKCGRAFANRAEARKHYQSEHADQLKLACACNLCGKKFQNKQGIYSHQRFYHSDARPFKCGMCEKTFKKQSYVTLHMRYHTDERPYACDLCGKKFRNLQTMRKHRLIHTGEKPFECAVCRKRFTQSSTLKTHMKVHA